MLVKVAAAVITIGLGGSAGLEGPSIHIGATVGSWLQQKLSWFGFEESDRRWMMLAGAAAGIAAIFKAPFTGIIFALEIPYRDDLAHRAFVPSLIASVTSYFVFVSIVGTQPLFVVPHLYMLDYKALVLATILGIICGLATRMFVVFFKQSGSWFRGTLVNPYVRALIGGILVSATGAISLVIFKAPLSLGTGYEAIQLILAGKLALYALVALFMLKIVATSATLNSGGVGGAFIPLILLGGAVGSAFGKIIGSPSTIYPIMGMAGFLAAGYNVPLAAAAFIAETTGSPAFIMPGLLAATISYVVSGRVGLSSYQRYGREMIIHRMLNACVADSMTAPAVIVPADTSISRFVSDFVVRYRHKSFPVVDGGELAGMVSITDIQTVPKSAWDNTQVIAVASKNVATVHPENLLSHVLAIMNDNDFDRLPVVSQNMHTSIVGIISASDIVRFEELGRFVRRDI